MLFAMFEKKSLQINEIDSCYSLGLFNVLRSENIKFWSLRSKYFIFAILFVFFVGGTAVDTFDNVKIYTESGLTDNTMEWTNNGLSIFFLLGMVASTTITAEYSTGQIVATFSAVPKKLSAILLKLLHNLLLVSCFALFSLFTASFLALIIRNTKNLGYGVPYSQVLNSIFSMLLYLLILTTICFCIGVIFRSTKIANLLIIGVFFSSPMVTIFLSDHGKIGKAKLFFPHSLGQRLVNGETLPSLEAIVLGTNPNHLSTFTTIVALLLWGFGTLALALLTVSKRDV